MTRHEFFLRVLAVAFVTASIVAALCLTGCQTAMETVTTTATDGTVTQIQRKPVDPWDAELAKAAGALMALEGAFQ